MNQELVKHFKQKLLEEKKEIKRILSGFAKQDKDFPENWQTQFPQFGNHRSEQDENADEVEEYTNLLPIEHRLELQLLDIETALVKIEKGRGYGICEKCGKRIEKKRLKAIPEAKFCSQCVKADNKEQRNG